MEAFVWFMFVCLVLLFMISVLSLLTGAWRRQAGIIGYIGDTIIYWILAVWAGSVIFF
jgi:hypothetical protein